MYSREKNIVINISDISRIDCIGGDIVQPF